MDYQADPKARFPCDAHAPHAPRRFFPPPDARIAADADDLIYPVFVLDGSNALRADRVDAGR
jgi:hypothetical protein